MFSTNLNQIQWKISNVEKIFKQVLCLNPALCWQLGRTDKDEIDLTHSVFCQEKDILMQYIITVSDLVQAIMFS